jgi:hypothetical protein
MREGADARRAAQTVVSAKARNTADATLPANPSGPGRGHGEYSNRLLVLIGIIRFRSVPVTDRQFHESADGTGLVVGCVIVLSAVGHSVEWGQAVGHVSDVGHHLQM